MQDIFLYTWTGPFQGPLTLWMASLSSDDQESAEALMVISDLVSLVVHAAVNAVWMIEPTKSDAKREMITQSTCHRRPAITLSQRLIIIARCGT